MKVLVCTAHEIIVPLHCRFLLMFFVLIDMGSEFKFNSFLRLISFVKQSNCPPFQAYLKRSSVMFTYAFCKFESVLYLLLLSVFYYLVMNCRTPVNVSWCICRGRMGYIIHIKWFPRKFWKKPCISRDSYNNFHGNECQILIK